MSQPTRFYIEVQDFLRKRFQASNPPSTPEIQQAVFGRSYEPDSSYQKQIIKQRIEEGRKKALQLWDVYCGSPEFESDFQRTDYYDIGEVIEEEKEDYYEFYAKLQMRRFGDETEVIMEYLQDYIIISRIWNNKLKEYSNQLNNLVISSYGKNARWKLPSWWKWAVRETDLYLRCVRTLQSQFKRGMSTKMLTASGQPLQRAIGYTTSIEGLLQDGQSWTCPNCGMYNSGTSKYCSNCGQEKPRSK